MVVDSAQCPLNFTEQCPKIGDIGDEKMVGTYQSFSGRIFKNVEIAGI